MRKYLVFILIVVGLFISSGQTYEEQTIIPHLREWLPNKPLEGVLMKIEIPYWGKLISVEERGYYAFVEFLIRKSAHFIVFGLLAGVLYFIFRKGRWPFFSAGAATLLLAILDEFHQLLTGGRTPSVRDVVLDMAGASFALGLIAIGRLKLKKNPLRKHS